MRFIHDSGRRGSIRGRYLYLSFGPGRGYCRKWWVKLNDGPGNARTPGTPCGHPWPRRCNSANCVRLWCRTFPRYFPLLVNGATLRIWLGPTYWRGKGLWHRLRGNWRSHRRAVREERRMAWDSWRCLPIARRVWGLGWYALLVSVLTAALAAALL